jgi:hypothetical protein
MGKKDDYEAELEALQIELRRYPSDSAFRNFFQQVDDSAL